MTITKHQLQKKLSSELVLFANCLAPCTAFYQNGTSLAQSVFDFLKRKLKHEGTAVSHTYIGGSVGKNTSVIFPDFDCVIFLNKTDPPLTRQVDQIRKILEDKVNADILKIDVGSLSTSEMTVKLMFKNGVEMDLLPASNYSQQNREEQYRHVLLRIQNPNYADAKYFSSSLAPMQLDFIRDQSGPTHQLIRIAKYWYKSGYFWCYGGCTIIEILCVCTALDLENSYSMLEGLKHFFSTYICNLDSLQIAFYRQNNSWTRILPEDIHLWENHFDPEVTSRSTYIIEPANPYNDLSQNLTDNLEEIKIYGNVMRKRLEELENPEDRDFKKILMTRDVDITYSKLFEPFKLDLKVFYQSVHLPSQVYVEYQHDIKFNWGTESTTVYKQSFFVENREAKWVYENILNNLVFLIRAKARRTHEKPLTFIEGLPQIDKIEDVKAAIKSFGDANGGVFKNCRETGWDLFHQNSFVTLMIPYFLNGQKWAVRYSLSWSNEPIAKNGCILF